MTFNETLLLIAILLGAFALILFLFIGAPMLLYFHFMYLIGNFINIPSPVWPVVIYYFGLVLMVFWGKQ